MACIALLRAAVQHAVQTATIEHVAREIGLHRNTLTPWLHGRRMLTVENLLRIEYWCLNVRTTQASASPSSAALVMHYRVDVPLALSPYCTPLIKA
jgi:transcriptional regulator with XRE-family HTH domain